jgi:tripartite-type tricarboxylate transporter receptor subunit TctC
LPDAYSDTWMAVVAPPGTPAEITQRLSKIIRDGINTPETAERIRGLQAEPLGSSPEEMRELIRQSEQRWSPIIQAAGITAE